MKIEGKEELRERLAAEYALGTLRYGARRRFETWLRQDRDLQQRAARWAGYVAPLAELVPEQRPPARVWDAIVRRIPVLGEARSTGWWNNLNLWRGLSGAAFAALALGIAVNLRHSEPVQETPPIAVATPSPVVAPTLVATISDPKSGRPVALLLMPEKGNDVVFKVLGNVSVPKNKVLQLWTAAGADQRMVSAGLVPAAGDDAPLRFAIANAETMRGAALIGVSLEPEGGSPQPTQVVGVGKWSHVRG